MKQNSRNVCLERNGLPSLEKHPLLQNSETEEEEQNSFLVKNVGESDAVCIVSPSVLSTPTLKGKNVPWYPVLFLSA